MFSHPRRVTGTKLALGASAALLIAASTAQGLPSPCGLRGAAVQSYMAAQLRQGHVRQLAAQSHACGGALGRAAVYATKAHPELARPLAAYATGSDSQGTGPAPDATAASWCSYPDIWSLHRMYVNGVDVVSIKTELVGWCMNGTVVLSTVGWQFKPWHNANTSFCPAAIKTAHGPDGAWKYSGGGWHSTWAHGAMWAYLGAGVVCYPFQGPYHAALRVNGGGGWDAYYDYGFGYPS